MGHAVSDILGGGQKPPSIPTPPPMAAPATMANSNVAATAASQRARAAAGSVNAGQNPTGPQGLTEAPKTAGATLLGQ